VADLLQNRSFAHFSDGQQQPRKQPLWDRSASASPSMNLIEGKASKPFQ